MQKGVYDCYNWGCYSKGLYSEHMRVYGMYYGWGCELRVQDLVFGLWVQLWFSIQGLGLRVSRL